MHSISYSNVIDITDNKPKICLNMIVKNESRVILRLLNSVVKILDGYCICDTGSTDNTIELITTFFKEHNIPGVIVQEPFKDFGYNRTYALQAAAKLPNMDYLLLLDADMILTGSCLQPENIASFKKSLTKDCYHLCQGTPTYFYKNVRIVKNYKGFSYWGVTHEYVNTPEGTQYDFIDNDKLFIQDIGDGGAKTDKFERDIKLLTKGLEENPNNDRYTFYLANSLKDAGYYERAIEMYRNRIQIGGWVEEVWYSYYNIGMCYRTIGQIEKAINTWLEGFDFYPKRLEGIYEVIKHYRENGKNKLAYLYYAAAYKSREKWGASADYLFLQKDVYDYKLDYELSIIGYYVNDENYNLHNMIMKVIANPHVDDGTVKNILANYKYYTKRLNQFNVPLLTNSEANITILQNATKSLNITESGEYVPSTPSILLRGNHLIVNVRYVNYRIDEHGGYVNQDKIQTKNAIAILDVSNPVWKNIQEFELKYDTTIDNYYVGLEDIRIFVGNDNKVYYNANRGLSYGNMIVEHGEIDMSSESTHNNRCLIKNEQSSIEKNWVLLPHTENGNESDDSDDEERLQIIYNWSPNIIIGKIVEDKFVETHQVKTPAFFKHLRGSTNGVVIKNEIWFICHLVSYEDRRYYYHIAVVLDKDTYELKRYTPLFTLEGEKVEYTLGFVYLEKNDSLLLGYSVYDKSTKYMNVNREVLEYMMITM
jgi:tetratricopeptide (TPR) repeat protein